jgi:hypothetical protein
MPGMAAELRGAIAVRAQWLTDRGLATGAASGEFAPAPHMMATLRKVEVERLVKELSPQLNAEFIASSSGARVSGIYDRAIQTPTGKIAVIRNKDTYTLAPWKPALEPMRGLSVTASLGTGRVVWMLDSGRALPSRA